MPDSSPLFLTTIATRTAIVLIALLVGIRLFGKREMSGMTVFDLVVVLALANAVQNAMTKGSGALAVGIVSAGTLLVVDHLLGFIFVRRPSLEARLIGTPVIVVQNGRIERVNLEREGITTEEVMAAIRGYGFSTLNQVKLAVLEADGTISIVPVDSSNQRAKK
jgi:uncharacterized membrane protein YcaP (DUF421 family)